MTDINHRFIPRQIAMIVRIQCLIEETDLPLSQRMLSLDYG